MHETAFCYRRKLLAEEVKEFLILYENRCATMFLGRGGLTRKDKDLLKNIWGEAHFCWTIKIQIGFFLLKGPIRFDIEFDICTSIAKPRSFLRKGQERPSTITRLCLFLVCNITKRILSEALDKKVLLQTVQIGILLIFIMLIIRKWFLLSLFKKCLCLELYHCI